MGRGGVLLHSVFCLGLLACSLKCYCAVLLHGDISLMLCFFCLFLLVLVVVIVQQICINAMICHILLAYVCDYYHHSSMYLLLI